MKKLVSLLLIAFVSTAINAQKIAAKLDQEVSIKLDEGTLYGSLLMPKSKTPVPVVLIIPGSGPTDRNCNSPAGIKTDAFIYLAEALYKKKIATLRIDKRISGKSMQTFAASLMDIEFNDFINDTEKWIEWLKKDERFSQVIIAGHSQGSLVGMLAAKNVEVDKFISLSGAGRSIDKILYDQIAWQMPQQKDTLKMFLDSLKLGGYYDKAPASIKNMVPAYLMTFMNQWINYDPAKIISALTIPSLIVNGDNDIQVGVAEAEILHKAKPDSKLVIIPKMNHILKDAPTDRLGNTEVYNQSEKPINKQLCEEIVRFVLN